jgi:hypothetical protein
MFLCEFLDSGDLLSDLREKILDYLTPLMVRKVEYVTVQEIEDILRNMRSGLMIDRGLVMELIDPTKIKAVKKIEGDKIYLNTPHPAENESGPDQAAKNADKVSNMATKQAKKEVTK